MQRKKNIGILTAFSPEIFRGEYFTRILAGIVQALRETPYHLQFVMVKDEKRAEGGAALLEHEHLAGLLVLSWRIHTHYIEEARKNSELPIVYINDHAPGLQANIVYCRSKMGIYLAMKHLIKRGAKRIGMLRAPGEDSLDAVERFNVYKDTLHDHGLVFDESLVRTCTYYFPQDGYVQTMDILKNNREAPDALMCFNDDLAFGALKALRDSGIECPRQVAVMGYDDMEKGRYAVPALTTVRQPLEMMGSEMVHVVCDLIEGKVHGNVHREFPQELIIRQSA